MTSAEALSETVRVSTSGFTAELKTLNCFCFQLSTKKTAKVSSEETVKLRKYYKRLEKRTLDRTVSTSPDVVLCVLTVVLCVLTVVLCVLTVVLCTACRGAVLRPGS